MAYEYDIFISYRRSPTVGEWVRSHLLPRLDARLDDVAGRNINISCDAQIQSGALWPAELKRRLRHSRVLLAVWSADYFRSSWCMAEWKSFKEREDLLGMFAPTNPVGLVYPIKYADGLNYHPDARLTQCAKDFSRLNHPDAAFRDSPRYLDFDNLVQELANDLVSLVDAVPDWQRDFPIVEPAPMPPTQLRRPVI